MRARHMDSEAKTGAQGVAAKIGRRQVLRTLGAIGAAALPDFPLGAQTSAPSPAKGNRIDVHHHFSAPGFIAAISARKTNQRPLEQWTVSKSLDDMDKSGVATAMISTSEPSVWFGDNEAARKLARECNELGARLMA